MADFLQILGGVTQGVSSQVGTESTWGKIINAGSTALNTINQNNNKVNTILPNNGTTAQPQAQTPTQTQPTVVVTGSGGGGTIVQPTPQQQGIPNIALYIGGGILAFIAILAFSKR